jgi:methyl-accepting chemotaxis protein-1 (serine sensor receptor)
MGRELYKGLGLIQRNFQDAAGMADEDMLEEAETMRDEFVRQLEAGRKIPVVDAALIDKIKRSFNDYYMLANTTTRALINDTGGDEVFENLRLVAEQVAELQADLEAMTERDKSSVADAFLAARSNQSRATQIMLLVIAICVGLLIFVSFLIIRMISAAVNTCAEVADNIASGNLDNEIISTSTDELGQLLGSLDKMQTNLTEVVGKIQATSSSVKTGADEMSEGNANLSRRTEEQASNLQETASSMEEMSSTVKQNADNAGEANQLAMAARDQAEKGGNVVSQAVTAMNEINASSKKISDIIGVIDEIAFQTNLLALNASVEAARAGDQGRGFAVVASEVRNLAGRSATAAKEIKDLIVDSAGKVEDGSRLVNESGEMLEEIVNGVKKVTDIVGEIAAASQEQSAGIDQVNKAVMQLDEMTQQNAALVEEASAASESMGAQADDMNQMMSFFTIGQDKQGSVPASNVSPPGGAEQRSANRPWSAPKTADTNKVVTAASATRRRAANGGDDQGWQEF